MNDEWNGGMVHGRVQRGPEAASQTEAEPARDSQTARADRSVLLEGSIRNHTQINRLMFHTHHVTRAL